MIERMRLIYGTSNPAKLAHMREALAPLNLAILSLNDVHTLVPSVDENGMSPLDNARIKAQAYYSAFRQPVFSCDSGLYIDGLPDDLQPGVHVRNVNGQALTDDEMITHYASLAASVGGQAIARYRNAICLVIGPGAVYEHDGEDIAGNPFILTSTPHARRVKGFPLDSLSIDMGTRKYYYDMNPDELLGKVWYDGFRRFFEMSLRTVAA